MSERLIRALVSARLRAHDAHGQTAAEYIGVLLVVSAIIAGVATTGVGHDITERSPTWCATSPVATPPRSNLTAVRLVLAVAAALAVLPAAAHGAGHGHAQPRADRARLVEVDERGRGQRRDAPGRRQAGGRRARRQAAGRRADRPARLRLEGERDLARRGLQGHRADDPGRPAGQGGVARRGERARRARAARRSATRCWPRRTTSGPREGRRSVVLVSDGGDNCAPPNPCEAAERGGQARRRPVDLGGRPPGQRARPPPAAVHRARGRRVLRPTCRTPASSATSWRRCSRARTAPTTRPGPRSRGADRRRAAGRTSAPGCSRTRSRPASSAGTRSTCPRAGALLASVTAIPPHESGGGVDAADRAARPGGRGGRQRVRACSPAGCRRPSWAASSTQSVRTDGRSDGRAATRSASRSTARQPRRGRVALELGVQFLAPGEEVGLTRDAGRAGHADADADAGGHRGRRRSRRRSRTTRTRSAGWWSSASAIAGLLIGLAAAAILGRRAAT